ncbi:MAG: MurR/RpiR family transcriptional regulator [Actinomycetota bacterium]|nr:MurR/RpiR family transcriptional regulator [Actinomycetota bacterium]
MATVAETLRARRAELTPGELRVAQALLADYPSVGLQSAGGLAAAAGVSTPTVVRLIAKLGFPGWAAMQTRLRSELSARSAGPVQLYPASRSPDSVLGRFEQALVPGVQQTLQATDPVEFDRAVKLLADDNRPVLLAGGRVSSALASYFGRYLQLVRAAVRTVDPDPSSRALALLDVDQRATVVVFDYRRYDAGTVAFGREAARREADVVLFTDPYLSPLSASAAVLLTSSVAGPPPFVTLTSAMALLEALALGVVESRGPLPRRRLQAFDRLTGKTSTG